jgi:hypothetical protein
VFYRATAADPLGVKRRRHIRLHGRTVAPARRWSRCTPRYDELAAALPDVAHSHNPSVLDADVALLDVLRSKGLELDAVLIADPAGIIAEFGRGLSDLYVAATRATKRLGILSPGEVPEVLRTPRP